jgi:hypothetical protein
VDLLQRCGGKLDRLWCENRKDTCKVLAFIRVWLRSPKVGIHESKKHNDRANVSDPLDSPSCLYVRRGSPNCFAVRMMYFDQWTVDSAC